MKAVILARVSSNEQEFGKSLEAQYELGLQYAQRKGLEVIQKYRIVESSTKGKRREFNEMISFVKQQKEPIAIISHTVDRFQRRFDESVELLPLVKNGKIELHFVSTGLVVHKDSPSADLMMWDFNVVGARAYILQLAENTKRGINKKIADGEWPTKAPIGYLNYIDGKYRKIKVDEERAPLVKYAFETYATGLYSVEELWRKLKEKGLKNTKGKFIDRNAVHKMLQNPFYYGEMNIKGKLAPHIYPPLIDRGLFERCEAVRKGFHKTPFKYGGKEFVFKGLLRCGSCGNRITSYVKIKPSGKKYTYLRCSKHSHENTCTAVQVQENVALADVEQALSRITITEEMATEIARHLTAYNKHQASAQLQIVRNATRNIRETEDKINRLVDLQLNGALPEHLFRQKLTQLQEEQNRLKLLREENTVNEDEFNISIEEVLDLAKNAVEIFKSSKISEKREILSCVFAPLFLKGKNLEIIYKKPFDLLVKGSNFLKSYRGRDLNP